MTSQPRSTACLLLAVVVGCAAWPLPAAAQATDQGGSPPFGGKLYRSVFSSGPGLLAADDLARAPEALRPRLAAYLERRAAFRSRYKGAPESIPQVRADAKKRAIERAIVSLVDAPDIAARAAAFVADAPIASSWGTGPEGPLAEADYAEDVLKGDPASPLAPWLYLFIAARQRAAFEASASRADAEGMKAAARKYRALAARARSAADPIVGAIMDDMEGLPHLYLETAAHPRDYNPDT